MFRTTIFIAAAQLASANQGFEHQCPCSSPAPVFTQHQVDNEPKLALKQASNAQRTLYGEVDYANPKPENAGHTVRERGSMRSVSNVSRPRRDHQHEHIQMADSAPDAAAGPIIDFDSGVDHPPIAKYENPVPAASIAKGETEDIFVRFYPKL
jgi:hypothetical protein